MTNILPLITIIIFGVCIFWLFFILPTYKTSAFGAQGLSGRVRYVVDGDSLYIDGHKPQVRLWGVNTPEIGEAGYQEAKDFLFQIAQGRRITCRKMHTSHKRTVAQCFLPDGSDIGGLMIKSGHAVEWRNFSKGYYSSRAKRAWTR